MKKYWIVGLVIAAALGIFFLTNTEKVTNTSSRVIDSSNVENNNSKGINKNDKNVKEEAPLSKDNSGKGSNNTNENTVKKPNQKQRVESDALIVNSFKEIELIHNNLKQNKKITKSQYNAFLTKYCYTKGYSIQVTKREWKKAIPVSNYTEVKIINKSIKQAVLKVYDKGKLSKWQTVTMVNQGGRWLVSKIQ